MRLWDILVGDTVKVQDISEKIIGRMWVISEAYSQAGHYIRQCSIEGLYEDVALSTLVTSMCFPLEKVSETIFLNSGEGALWYCCGPEEGQSCSWRRVKPQQ